MRAVLISALALAAATATAGPTAAVDPSRQAFVLADGRTAVFHGLNAVYKLPPYIPCWDCPFDPLRSLNQDDVLALRRLGVTAIRLGVMVEAVLPSELGGAVNATYVQEMVRLSERLGEQGIFTLVDAHQDLLSRAYCGEGFPPALVTPPNMSAWERFPSPLPVTIQTDPATHLPNLTQCEAVPFALFNAAIEVNAAWGMVYNDATVRAALRRHWGAVATAFGGAAANASSPLRLLGYELLNEPMPFPITSAIEPGAPDRQNLAPLYADLYQTVRAADASGTVLYEPAVTDLLLGQVPGFTAGPGGHEDDDRQALALHIYCNALNRSGDVINASACDDTVDGLFDLAARSFAATGGGRMLTEFGAVGDAESDAEMLTSLLDRCDEGDGLSWAYWNFKPFHDITTVNGVSEGLYAADGTMQRRKAAALARAYPHLLPASPSAPSTFRFDHTSPFRELVVQYTVGSANAPSRGAAPASTTAVLYGSPDFHYVGGAEVVVEPPGAGVVSMEPGPDGGWSGWAEVEHPPSAVGLAVRLTLRALLPQNTTAPTAP